MIRAVEINMKQNNQENNNIFWMAGRLEEYQKGFLGIESKKGENFL
jgi:hypothetical protein